jgi:hypothetical protein
MNEVRQTLVHSVINAAVIIRECPYASNEGQPNTEEFHKLSPIRRQNGTGSFHPVPSISLKTMCRQQITPQGEPFLLSCFHPYAARSRIASSKEVSSSARVIMRIIARASELNTAGADPTSP